MKVDAFGAVSVGLALDLESIPPPLYPPPLPTSGPNPPPKIQGFGAITVELGLDLASLPKEEAFGPISVTATGELFLDSISDPEAFGTITVERASVDYAASFLTNFELPELLIWAPLPLRGTGRPCPPPPHVEVQDMPLPLANARWEAGPMAPPGAPVSLSRPGTIQDLTIGGDWFDRIHVLPREAIDFGRFVTPVSAEFELFNAHHHRAVVLASVTDLEAAGLVLEGFPALPYNIPPFNSLLDPASVKFAPVKARVTTTMIGARKF